MGGSSEEFRKFDLLTFQRLEAPYLYRTRSNKGVHMQFHIETMTCSGCARGVTKAIQIVDAAATVKVDLSAQTVTVSSSAPREQVVAALTDAGFAPDQTQQE